MNSDYRNCIILLYILLNRLHNMVQHIAILYTLYTMYMLLNYLYLYSFIIKRSNKEKQNNRKFTNQSVGYK